MSLQIKHMSCYHSLQAMNEGKIMNNFSFSDLKCCPFCGCETYYEKQTVKGKIEFNSMFNGEEAPNYDMYEGLIHTYSGRCYCRDCNAYLGNNLTNTVSKAVEHHIEKRR